MADVKISGLPASSVPLAGTEVLPIVQGGQTRQVSVNNLTAGKAISATQYTSTIVTGTAPLIVASTTEVANLKAANATSADTANQVKSNATTGVLQIAGPTTATTRVMTTPDANFTAARTDAGQTFTGSQTINGVVTVPNLVDSGGSYKLNNGSNAASRSWRIANDISNYGDFAIQQSTTQTGSTYANIIYSTAGGVVGINSAPNTAYNAAFKLQVGADSGTNGIMIRGAESYLSFDNNVQALGSGRVYYNMGSHYMDLFTNNTAKVRIASGGDVTVNTGNLVMGTAAKGIDFSANTGTAGATKEILDWYEEGTWTPTVTSQTGAITTYVSGGTYTRVGRQVTVTAYADLTTVGTAGGLLVISNFPYKNGAASSAGYLQQSGIVRETGITGVNYACFINGNSTTGYIQSFAGGAITWGNSYQYALSITYYTA